MAGGGDIDHRERQEEHPLVAGLQIGQQLRCVFGKGNEIGWQDVGIISGPHRLALFLHFHFSNVGQLAFYRFNSLELIHRLNVHSHSQLCVQFQDLRQELVRELRSHDLQIGGRAPILAHPEQAGVPEVEAVRGDIVLCPHPCFGNILPGEAERLPVPRVHLAVKQGQPRPPVQGLRGHPQPFEVACHIGLHALQPGPGLPDPLGGEPKGDIFGTLDPVVRPGDLIFQHPRELAPDTVEAVLRLGDIHPVFVPGAGAADKGKLERQRAVKVMEE